MITILQDRWHQITENHWVHPKIGYIKYIFNEWQAVPKPSIVGGDAKAFPLLNQAMEYMNSLNTL